MPIDVGEAPAVGAIDEDRGVIEEPVHPQHRDAERHRAARSVE
jgi:hypothetical protein